MVPMHDNVVVEQDACNEGQSYFCLLHLSRNHMSK